MVFEKLIKVAAIVGAHGIKGEVKLRSFLENVDLFNDIGKFCDSTGNKIFSIKITGEVKDAIIAKIEGVNDRNSAELLKGTELFVPASSLPIPDDGEFYHSQLIGLEVRLENGKKIGKTTAIHNYGAGDIVEITMDSGDLEMLPLAEPWVDEINIDQGFIVVELAEYL